MKQNKIQWQDQNIFVTCWNAKNEIENTPLLLCLHGLGFDGYLTFHKLGEYFSKHHFNVITFDFPGFGESELKTDRELNLTDLTDLIEHIRLNFSKDYSEKKILLLSHSMAGIMALEYILRYTDNVSGYCSIEGNCIPGGGYLSKKFIRLDGKRLQRFWDLFIRQIENNPEQQSMSEEYITALKRTTPETIKRYSDILVNKVPENLFNEASNKIEHKCFLYTPLSPEGNELAELYQVENYKVIQISNALHDMINSQPEITIRILEEWIEEISS